VLLHWAGPLALATIAVILLLLALVLDVPLTRTLGASALVMASSLLTPIEPLDGAFVSKAGYCFAHLPCYGVTTVVALALLLAGMRSAGWLELTVAVFTIVPRLVGRTTIVTVPVSPLANSARLHSILLGFR
jgi:hypothetical protein